ncbi:MAG: hypothetical protein LBU83_14200 [Bacteroidales bacterium]|jgi:hypothetical protein|nr:hypothetical protein [Bacteroidales bacterium]
MKKEFRLYNKFQSNFFDLISGNLEPQQTKGLGLLLSKSDTSLKLFFKLLSEKGIKIDFDKIVRTIVNCELTSIGEPKYRADIVLRLYSNEGPYKAFLIEAKSINKGTSSEKAGKQVDNYQDKNAFEELKEFGEHVVLITLTKHKSFTTDSKTISITWNEIINAFQHSVKTKKDNSLDNELMTDYYNFLTNIKDIMKFYEKEVFSVPAGNSYNLVMNSHVYECPNEYKNFQKPLFLALRKGGGGEMECLFTIDELFGFNFKENYYEFIMSDQYDESVKAKVKKYVELADWETKGFPADEKLVFILSDRVIKFQEPYPRPEKNQTFRAYYELADMFDEEIKLKL